MSNNLSRPRSGASAQRLFGGPPLAVLLRLAFVSLVVGALLMWLRIEPLDVVDGAIRAGERLWAMGFDAIGQLGHYLLAGAVIVVPVWLLMRLFMMRGAR